MAPPAAVGADHEAVNVSNRLDEEGRDMLLLQLLENADEALVLLAIECVSVLPLANLQHQEIEHLVRFARHTYETGQSFQGRSEEKLMHVFRTLGRLAQQPEIAEGRNAMAGGLAEASGTSTSGDAGGASLSDPTREAGRVA